VLHAVPVLWRCHALHHSDREVDVSTSYRHHPFEPVILSFVLPLSAMAIGIPGDVIIVYGVVDAVASVFHHGNVKLPPWLERVLAPIIVTPDMHRIHHSIERSEADSNFGTVFSFWDRLFASYTAPVRQDRRRLEFGLAEFSSPAYQTSPMMMMIPFRRGERSA